MSAGMVTENGAAIGEGEDALIALDRAAWVCGHARGRIEGVGLVEIERHGRRRFYAIDGRKSTGRRCYELARGAA